MTNYRGPATLTLAGEEGRPGTAVLHASRPDGRADWRGSFTPDDGAPVNVGNGTLSTATWSGEVLIQDWRFAGGGGNAILLGQGNPPF